MPSRVHSPTDHRTSLSVGCPIRVFALDRIKMLHQTKETFEVPEDFSFKDFTIEADTIVVSHAGVPDNALYRALKEGGTVGELYAVGDCVAARFTDSAIREGNEAGRKVCSES